MTYLRPSRRRGRRSYRPFVRAAIGALILIVLLILHAHPPTFLSRALLPIAKPLWSLQAKAATVASGVYVFFTDKNVLLEQIKALQAENSDLQVAVLIANEAAIENQTLRALGGRADNGKYITASVLSRPPISPYDTLVIDVGSADGISVGNQVAVDQGLIIGDVISVTAHNAIVSLYSAPGRETNVLIGTNHVPVPARGQGGGEFEVRVPKGEVVAQGDPVSVPGISPRIFGVVAEINSSPSDPFDVVRFTLPINLFTVQYVSIFQ